MDRNFKMTSDLLTLIYKKDFDEQTDLEKIRDISSDLMLNLSNIWPFSKPSAMLISVPRENYARKLAKRNVKFFSCWFNRDTFVKPETSSYSNEPHKTVKSANWHCEWFYYKFVNPEIYREFLDFAWLKRKK